MTTFENKCTILSDLWLNFRLDEEFADFMQYNDLGLPLAYAISEGVVEATEIASTMIEETFSLLLAASDIEDTGFENLNQILGID